MKAELKDAIAEVKTAKEARDRALTQLADRKTELARLAPVSTGEIIAVNGHSHRGKKMLVMSIHVKDGWKGELFFVAKGHVLKKCGEPSDSMQGESTFNMDGSPA